MTELPLRNFVTIFWNPYHFSGYLMLFCYQGDQFKYSWKIFTPQPYIVIDVAKVGQQLSISLLLKILSSNIQKNITPVNKIIYKTEFDKFGQFEMFRVSTLSFLSFSSHDLKDLWIIHLFQTPNCYMSVLLWKLKNSHTEPNISRIVGQSSSKDGSMQL